LYHGRATKCENGGMPSAADDEPRVFRDGGISYLHIPAGDPRRTAAFYRAVFGWSVRGHADHPSFEDGTGHVIGHFVSDLPVAGAGGEGGESAFRRSSTERSEAAR